MKEKDLYAPAGWKFPGETELYIDRSDSKPRIKERKNIRSEKDLTRLAAEFPLYGKPNDPDACNTWALAKSLARDILKSSYYDGVVICHREPGRNIGRTYDTVCVYSKFANALTVPKSDIETPQPVRGRNFAEIPAEPPTRYKIRFFTAKGPFTDETEPFYKEDIESRAKDATLKVDRNPEKYAGWALFRWGDFIGQWCMIEDAFYDTGRRSGEEVHEIRHVPILPSGLTES